MSILLTTFIGLVVIFLIGPRAKLRAACPDSRVPTNLSLPALAAWLTGKEHQVAHLVEGAGAHIQFANPAAPAKTPLCFVYIHGFSATWPETAPVTERLAAQFSANSLQARLAGHGTTSEDMKTPAEAWLESTLEAWEIATQLGDKVVLVATSTGAPLSVWLASLPGVTERLHALLFMSPNFQIRTRFAFLLTAPWSRHWVHFLIGREREWQPVDEAQAKYWTWRYSTLALIEMQKVVNWARGQNPRKFTTPLAIMYMKHDPTINPKAAIALFDRWGTEHKALIPVTIDGEAAEHVFTGDIAGPQRTDWTVAKFAEFLRTLPAPKEH